MAIFDTLAVAQKVAIFENFVAEKHENVLATLDTWENGHDPGEKKMSTIETFLKITQKLVEFGSKQRKHWLKP